ncbi:hypothetical protein [Maridesulfovibrio bastinii]|uniref:hypothetical protein n=1 Tax=Maridesulfovibrio bastinii TaxID=47157 RepID=UPI0003FD9D66|nr:hypothetical protein [Maridesulfovibrio bastinii]
MSKLSGLFCFKTLSLLGSTALPGAQRIFLYFLVEHFFGLQFLGRFANDLSIIFMIGYFTAVGWSSMIMIRVPQTDGLAKLQTLFTIAKFSFFSLIPSCIIIYFLGYLGFIFNPDLSSFVLVSWSLFMLFRRFMLALKRYHILFAAELLVLTGIAVILWFGRKYPFAPYFSYAVPCAVVTLTAICLTTWLLKKNKLNFFNAQPGVMRHGLEFGLNNFVSGGRMLLLTPLVVQIAGEIYGGIIGLINSVLGVVQLFPRTLSQFHLPEMSRLVKNGDSISFIGYVSKFRKQVSALLTLIFLFSAIGWWAIGLTPYGVRLHADGAVFIFYIMLIATVIDQAVIADANSLMVRELSFLMLKVNFWSSIIMLLMMAGVVFLNFVPLLSVYSILSVYLVSNLLRSVWLVKLSGNYKRIEPKKAR